MAYAIKSQHGEWRVVTKGPDGEGVEGSPTTNLEQVLAELEYLQTAFKAADQGKTKVELQGRAVGDWERIEDVAEISTFTNTPMLYSSESLRVIDELRERLGQELKSLALDRVRRDGRNLVTDEDVWKSFAISVWFNQETQHVRGSSVPPPH